MGADLDARREHANETIRTRLLTVNFYLETLRWPIEFVFDHQQKISKLCRLGCEPVLFPQRKGRPYLWRDILLQRPSGELILTMVDHFGRTSSFQFRVRRAVPVVRPLVANRQQLRELRALRLASRELSDPQQQHRHVIHNNATHTNNGVSAEEGGVSW